MSVIAGQIQVLSLLYFHCMVTFPGLDSFPRDLTALHPKQIKCCSRNDPSQRESLTFSAVLGGTKRRRVELTKLENVNKKASVRSNKTKCACMPFLYGTPPPPTPPHTQTHTNTHSVCWEVFFLPNNPCTCPYLHSLLNPHSNFFHLGVFPS